MSRRLHSSSILLLGGAVFTSILLSTLVPSANAGLEAGGFKIKAFDRSNSSIVSIAGGNPKPASENPDPTKTSKYALEISYTLRCDTDTQFETPMVGDRNSGNQSTSIAFDGGELQDVSGNPYAVARTLKAGETHRITVAGNSQLILDRYGRVYGNAAPCYRSIDSIKSSESTVDLSGLALGLTNLQSVPEKVPAVTGLKSAFQQTQNLHSDLSQWDVSRVSSFYGLFYMSRNFSGDVSTWDTRSVESMEKMLYDGQGFMGDLSRWNTAKVATMSQAFSFSDFDGDLSNWNVSSVKDFGYMFNVTSNFRGIGLEKWRPESAESMVAMFQQVPNLKADFTSWGSSTGNAKDMSYMFNNTSPLGNFKDWDVKNVTSYDSFGLVQEPKWVH